VVDAVASEHESVLAAAAIREAVEGAPAIDARVQVALEPSLVVSGACPAPSYALLSELRERCRVAVATLFGEAPARVLPAGTLLSRVLGSAPTVPAGGPDAHRLPSTADDAPSYCHAHVDKCAIPSYDLSAVLYLSSMDSCEGGSFAFVDHDGVERRVEPAPGRLLAFTSGVENVHRVSEVTQGERLAMAMWFTLSRDV
jgi:hypothetical protein